MMTNKDAAVAELIKLLQEKFQLHPQAYRAVVVIESGEPVKIEQQYFPGTDTDKA